MSEAGGQMLMEDVEALGPVKIKDVEAAQQEIIGVARTLEAKGVLSLSGGPNEQYVV
jgi:flagellar motor switch protein FliG